MSLVFLFDDISFSVGICSKYFLDYIVSLTHYVLCCVETGVGQRTQLKRTRLTPREILTLHRISHKKMDIKNLNSTSLSEFDYIIVALSGGKDSVACLLHLLDLGVSTDKIECWHHCIDGDPEAQEHFMDWKCTTAYVQALCDRLNVPLYLSWRDQGYYAELTKNNSPSKGVYFEDENWKLHYVASKSKSATRGLFPQQSGSLRTRWCSSSLKIEVGGFAIRHQKRFLNRKTLIVTGERREESPGRAKYLEWQEHASHTKSRAVLQWRPVIDWSSKEVWDVIKEWGIVPHPAYWLGFGRTSCMGCIFLNNSDWARVNAISPSTFQRISKLEKASGKAIDRKGKFLPERVEGEAVQVHDYWKEVAESAAWAIPIQIRAEEWKLPPGAKRDLSGGSW